jgi:hypothetical protein
MEPKTQKEVTGGLFLISETNPEHVLPLRISTRSNS